MTLAELLTSIGTVITDYVDDFGIFIAGGAVLGLAVFAVRRLIKSTR